MKAPDVVSVPVTFAVMRRRWWQRRPRQVGTVTTTLTFTRLLDGRTLSEVVVPSIPPTPTVDYSEDAR